MPIYCTGGFFEVCLQREIMTGGVWSELARLQDPELCRLAEVLPSTVLSSRAESTVAKYGYAFQQWKAWAECRKEVLVFPISEVHFALYLQHLSDSTHSLSAVQEAVNAIGWVNQLSGQAPIAQSPIVSATVAGLKRGLAKPKAGYCGYAVCASAQHGDTTVSQ